MREAIEVGFQAYTTDGGDPFGAVRDVDLAGGSITIYVENSGDFIVPAAAIASVHSQKVVIALDRVDPRVRDAIIHAHDAEEPGL
ncbi:MAG TPA: hypothetical protein VM734_25240 [Kofleriaceae bacterium]|jgi:hypothetical protein|nr:hypothetical protein [Kofleriaceae bacterium]